MRLNPANVTRSMGAYRFTWMGELGIHIESTSGLPACGNSGVGNGPDA